MSISLTVGITTLYLSTVMPRNAVKLAQTA
jgi:hypothetical protein